MPDRRCCCRRDCWSVSDDFDRTDNDDPGSAWLELSGDWDILDEYLHCASEGILITTHRQPHPTRSGSKYTLTLDFCLVDVPSEGTKDWKIICGFEDEDNFDWVHLEFDAANEEEELVPTFYTRTGGVDSVVMDPDDWYNLPFPCAPGTPLKSMRICYASADWSVTDGDLVWQICGGGKEELPTNVNHGLVGFLKGDFDNWVYTEHWESNLDCEWCQCFCLNDDDYSDFACFPETLTMTFVPKSNYTCTHIDNVSLTMYQGFCGTADEQAEPEYKPYAWKASWFSDTIVLFCDPWDPENPDCIKAVFELVCSTGGNLTMRVWKSNVDGSLGPSSGAGFEYGGTNEWPVSSCNPLHIVFPNFNSGWDNCCIDAPGCEEPGVFVGICPDGECIEEEGAPDVYWDVVVTE